jgi:hypothetical protein
MDLIEGSETSANINQTLGIHPKIETVKVENVKRTSVDPINGKAAIVWFLDRQGSYRRT